MLSKVPKVEKKVYETDQMHNVSNENELKDIIDNCKRVEKVLIIKCTAKWAQAPSDESLTKQFSEICLQKPFENIICAEMDVDNVAKSAVKFDITTMPAFLFFKSGQVIKKICTSKFSDVQETLDNLDVKKSLDKFVTGKRKADETDIEEKNTDDCKKRKLEINSNKITTPIDTASNQPKEEDDNDKEEDDNKSDDEISDFPVEKTTTKNKNNNNNEPKKLIRKSFVMSVNEGSESEYEKRHSPIWEDLKDVLKKHGVHNYSIFLLPNTRQLFAYAEVESEEQWSTISKTDICQKWWKHMSDIMPCNDDSSPKTQELNEVFHIE